MDKHKAPLLENPSKFQKQNILFTFVEKTGKSSKI
jgi:hypothetical protein